MILLNLLALAIGIGLVFTVLLTEFFGLAAGGLVVPGYVALKLMQPWSLVFTLVIAYLAFFIVKSLSGFIVIYGRRRTALTILTGYLLGAFSDLLFGGMVIFTSPEAIAQGEAAELKYLEFGVIGYIIPGLIAIWFDRQGVFRTITGLILTATLVRLSLILIMPDAVSRYELDQQRHLPSWEDILALPQEKTDG